MSFQAGDRVVVDRAHIGSELVVGHRGTIDRIHLVQDAAQGAGGAGVLQYEVLLDAPIFVAERHRVRMVPRLTAAEWQLTPVSLIERIGELV